jgi:CdiI immunity protein
VTIRYGDLRMFCLTRFHEDWQLDAASRAKVVDDFVSTENPVLVEAVISNLRSLLAEGLPEDELYATMLREYSLSFDPHQHEISMDEWLRGLLKELLAAVGREDG